MNARRYILSTSIDETPFAAAHAGGLEGLESPEVTNTIDVNKLPDALVTGTTLLDLSTIQSADVRAGISLAMLFASRVATKKSPANEDEWLAEYQTALSQLGFSVAGSALLTSRFAKTNVAVHQAIIPFLTIAFGGAAVGPVILALLDNLKTMDGNSPWITVFDQQSKRFDVREMHFAAAAPNGNQTEIRYAVARLHVDTSTTQVLFFKLSETNANFESLTTTMAVDNGLMAVSQEDLQQRLSKLVKSYIWAAEI